MQSAELEDRPCPVRYVLELVANCGTAPEAFETVLSSVESLHRVPPPFPFQSFREKPSLRILVEP